jgi:MYXO-CTERM domain-containing protein
MADSLDREPRGPLGFLAVLGGTLHREPRRRGRS